MSAYEDMKPGTALKGSLVEDLQLSRGPALEAGGWLAILKDGKGCAYDGNSVHAVCLICRFMMRVSG